MTKGTGPVIEAEEAPSLQLRKNLPPSLQLRKNLALIEAEEEHDLAIATKVLTNSDLRNLEIHNLQPISFSMLLGCKSPSSPLTNRASKLFFGLVVGVFAMRQMAESKEIVGENIFAVNVAPVHDAPLKLPSHRPKSEEEPASVIAAEEEPASVIAAEEEPDLAIATKV
ncbi:50S ribosomal protein L15 [Striga asiatica]|uniref:50S ribosomal protein L15 n=1 Tax=Striga asiatica TaxID=4170 RepID=A0A5A7RC51_STRAF|nr:50S ribosomal protein L15 [Striga asiatica]